MSYVPDEPKRFLPTTRNPPHLISETLNVTSPSDICSGPTAAGKDGYAAPAPTYDLLGVGMSILNMEDAVARILGAVVAGKKGYICVTGMHGIMEARDDSRLQKILNEAFLCTPDGMPTVWLGKAKGHRVMARVYGPDLMLTVMEATSTLPIRHFFYGGAEGVAAHLAAKMVERFPGVQIAGTYCPPFRPLNEAERRDLRTLVEQSGADILWVGLSTPKQERFMAEFLPLLPVKVMLGVGAAFDFHTGRAKQAPRWMMRLGLEWFFRLVTEPKRLWRRYMIQVPRFISLVGLDRLGLVSHSADTPEMPQAFNIAALAPRIVLGEVGLGVLLYIFAFLLLPAPLIFPVMLWTLVSLAALFFSTLILFCSLEEDRLDRVGPVVALSSFLYCAFLGALAIFSPVLYLVSRSQELLLNYTRQVAQLSCVPIALYLGLFCLLAFGASLARKFRTLQRRDPLSHGD